MLILIYVFIFSFVFLPLSNAQRRILDGKSPNRERGYLVYLLKADHTVKYDAWICGGAIVTPSYIVTSAACVEDVKHMYAIAGTSNYVRYDNIDEDECTKSKKKKIVFICLPSAYNFDYPRVEMWANIDIALAKVESPYDFTDRSYLSACMYQPSLIEINYDIKMQIPGTDAVVFGWGHNKKWRAQDDPSDYNAQTLNYGSVRLANRAECKKSYENPKIQEIIDKYMICTIEGGDIDDAGEVLHAQSKFQEYCMPGDPKCNEQGLIRRNNQNKSITGKSRRTGICQNDHGGPIITWRGPKEIVIGIASVFRVSEDFECIPPFLYTSTYCNGAFLHCMLNDDDKSYKDTSNSFNNEDCKKPAKERGFEVIRRTISWVGHPDGPAENEQQRQNHQFPPQSPVESIQSRNPDAKLPGKIELDVTENPNTNEAQKQTKSEQRRAEERGEQRIMFSDIIKDEASYNPPVRLRPQKPLW